MRFAGRRDPEELSKESIETLWPNDTGMRRIVKLDERHCLLINPGAHQVLETA